MLYVRLRLHKMFVCVFFSREIKSHFIKNSDTANYAETENKDNTIKCVWFTLVIKTFTSNQLQATRAAATTTTTMEETLVVYLSQGQEKTENQMRKKRNGKKSESVLLIEKTIDEQAKWSRLSKHQGLVNDSEDIHLLFS